MLEYVSSDSRGSWRSGERDKSQKTVEGLGIVLRTGVATDGVYHGASAKCLESNVEGGAS